MPGVVLVAKCQLCCGLVVAYVLGRGLLMRRLVVRWSGGEIVGLMRLL